MEQIPRRVGSERFVFTSFLIGAFDIFVLPTEKQWRVKAQDGLLEL